MRIPKRYATVPFVLAPISGLIRANDSLPKIVKSLASTGTDAEKAAKILGVSVEIFHEVLEKFEELRVAWEQGQAIADTMVILALYEKATSGDIRAQTFWLSNRMPDVWTLYGKNTAGAVRKNGGRPEKQADPLEGLKLIG